MAAKPSLRYRRPRFVLRHRHHKTKHVTFDLPAQTDSRPPQDRNQLISTQSSIDQMDEATLSMACTLAYLDSDAGIPKSLLIRAGRPLRRWALDGEPEEISPRETGIMPELVDTLCSAEGSEIVTKQLRLYGFLGLDTRYGGGGDDSDLLRMDAGIRAMCKQKILDPNYWMLQALLLVCHAFPTDAHLDVDFYELGLFYIVQFQHVITRHYDRLRVMDLLSIETQQIVAYALIASSHFSSTTWKLDAIERAGSIAAGLATPDECLDMMILTRKTDLFYPDSMTLPEIDYQFPNPHIKSKKLYALCGELLLARSTLQLQQSNENINTAFSLLHRVQPVDRNHISTLEELILQKKAICWGRIRRFQGRFEVARQVLEDLYNARQYPEGVVSVGASSCDLISELAATHCELGNPVEAEMLISARLESIFDGRPMRERTEEQEEAILRLRLALAEAVLHQAEYWRAEDIYRDVDRRLCITQGARRPESIRSTCRLNIGLARVQHVRGQWVSALKRWERALRVYEKYPFAQDFGTAVVCASVSYVRGKLGDAHGAALYADKARKLLEVTGCWSQYAGLGTWLEEVLL
ncbi:hypothetical protein UA08_05508 [Talaromyces atroroseus]|uniref:Uncharacterized protein n=1 Tax=Talaromyces atroroseus TaxID=1441469 RepID=A0A225AUI2_TALAT|nr:hypothetical protein UA08_05508 [Talaromyces atroroseus]OKL59259.1 hypothetical protein UA08_05508 [Talaromyces atroroseus]